MFIRGGNFQSAIYVARRAESAANTKKQRSTKHVAFKPVEVSPADVKHGIPSQAPRSTDIVFPSHSAHPQSGHSTSHIQDKIHRAVEIHMDEKRKAIVEFKVQQRIADLVSMQIDSNKDVIVGKLIGKGGFAEVFVGQYQGQKIAIKKFSSRVQPNRVANEWNLMRACFASPYINPVYGYDMNTSMIIIKYADRGSLHGILSNKIDPLNWLQRLQILRDVAAGLDYLHNDEKIIHRDIKSGNILVSFESGRLKARISDFSEAIQLPGPTNDLTGVSIRDLSKNAGTLVWMSPECMLQTPVSTATDIYSYGMLLLEMTLDTNTFNEYFRTGTWNDVHNLLNTRQKLIDRVVKDIKATDASLAEIADLIQVCTCYDVDKRVDAKYILTKLDKLLGKSHSNDINKNVFEAKADTPAPVSLVLQAKTVFISLPKLQMGLPGMDVKAVSSSIDPDIKRISPKVVDAKLDVKLYAPIDTHELLTLIEYIAQNYNSRYERSNILEEILSIVNETSKPILSKVEDIRVALLKIFHPDIFPKKSLQSYFFGTSKTDHSAVLNFDLGEYKHLAEVDQETQILHAMLYALSSRHPQSTQALRGETSYQQACNDLRVWDFELKVEMGYRPAFK